MQSIFFVILFYSYSSFLPKGVDSIHIEIFDECAFSADEKIAWALFPIPNTVFAGETIENWIPLNGKQGDSKEGTICLFLSFSVSLYLIFISSLSLHLFLNIIYIMEHTLLETEPSSGQLNYSLRTSLLSQPGWRSW